MRVFRERFRSARWFLLRVCGFSSNFESAVVGLGCLSVWLGWFLVSGVESGGFSMCEVVSVFRVRFSRDFRMGPQ
jgi:hypothetical protein